MEKNELKPAAAKAKPKCCARPDALAGPHAATHADAGMTASAGGEEFFLH